MSEDYTLDPPAINGSPAHAFASHRTRASAIARQYALDNPLNVTGGTATEDNTIQLIAHLQAASDDPEFSRILAPKVLASLDRGHGQVGTTVDEDDGTFLGFGYHLDGRPGDYDPALKGLMVIAYRYRHLLTDEVFNLILDKLVPSHLPGADVSTFEKYSLSFQFHVPIVTIPLDIPKEAPETENHMLLISSAVYLVNQLFFARTGEEKYNNRENGLAKWLLGHMQTIAKHDFLEFNARPYHRYSLHALLNLHEFAQDDSIRIAAQILLDYIMVKFAIASNRQRRIGPFRRLKEYTNRPDNPHNELLLPQGEGNDAVIGFFLMYAGPTNIAGNPLDKFPAGWGFEALIAGLAAYRPPPAAYILAMQRDIPPFQHRFYHGTRPKLPGTNDQADGGVEIYYHSPSFLLTAGGMFLNSGYGGDEFTKGKQTAIAQSTTLLPTQADVKFADLIRFDPYPDERRAVNTAVHLGFACGANLRPCEKKIFEDTGTHAPAVASSDGHLFLAWKGSGNENLNAAKVYTTGVLGIDGIEGLEGKVTLGDTSEESPALASHNGRLFLAWKGAGNDNLNLIFSDDNGVSFHGTATFGDSSHQAPALASHNGRLFLAWTGRGDGNLNVAKVSLVGNTVGGFGIEGLEDKVVLGDTSEEAPALTSHNGRLFLAWKGAGNDNLNLIFSDDNGVSFHGTATFGDSSHQAPALASHNGRLFLAWTGRGDGNLNVAKVSLVGNTVGGFGIEGLEDKVVLGDTSEEAPALASYNGRLFLAWKGAGNDNLNLLCSQDGLFQAGPWFFSDLSKFGLYVTIYRTAPAQPEQLDTFLDNLGLLYAMEARGMSFENFKQLTLERNTTLPVNFEYGGNYIFHSADDHRFSFLLHPSLVKYQAQIVRMDEPNPVTDFSTLPLIEGPYLRASGGHDGLIEVRHPGCETTPLVLDFRDPEKPVRLDNINACPEPWLDRTQALLDFAQILSRAGKHKEQLAALTDRVKIYQQLAEIDPGRYGPDLASALNMLAGSSLILAQQFIAAQRIDEVSTPALESIQAYRQAAAKGIEATGIAATLSSFSLQLAGVGLSAESISAAQTAVDVLRGVQPPATEQATYLDTLARCLLTLAQRLMATQRIDEVSPVALESIQVYRQAVAKGAEATGIAATLSSFSLQLAGVGLSAESISAAQTAVDVLRGVQPPATEQATYLDTLAGCLLTLAQQLIATQRIDEVAPPALESIQAYQQAAAKGIEATGIAATLSSFSLQLAGVGLSAESISAAQTAVDVLRGVQPPATEQATYLDRLAGCLLTLAQQLIAAQRIDEVSPPALESIQVYRQAVAKGAEATGIVATLSSFSLQLAGVGLSAESISAAQAATDLAI